MFKDVRYVVWFLLFTIFILWFFIKFTLFSNINEIEIRTNPKSEIYTLNSNIKLANYDVSTDVVISQKLKFNVIVPYILSYISNSWDYEYWVDIFSKLDEIDNIKVYFLYNNKIISENNLVYNDFKKLPQFTWHNRFWIERQKVNINNKYLDKLQFIIEFDWIKWWNVTKYESTHTFEKIEKKYFWNMFIYFLWRNF